MTGLLEFNQFGDGLFQFILGRIALVAIGDMASGFQRHDCIHDTNRRDVLDGGLALELRRQQVAPACDLPAYEVRTNAQCVCIVNTGAEACPTCWGRSERRAIDGVAIHELKRRVALAGHFLAGEFSLRVKRRQIAPGLDL